MRFSTGPTSPVVGAWAIRGEPYGSTQASRKHQPTGLLSAVDDRRGIATDHAEASTQEAPSALPALSFLVTYAACNWLDRAMSVRHALLTLVSEGPKDGLQLRQEFEARTGEVWPLNVGQVYTTLQWVEPDGLVESEGTEDGPPDPSLAGST